MDDCRKTIKLCAKQLDQEEKQRKEMCFRLSTDLQELIEQSMTQIDQVVQRQVQESLQKENILVQCEELVKQKNLQQATETQRSNLELKELLESLQKQIHDTDLKLLKLNVKQDDLEPEYEQFKKQLTELQIFNTESMHQIKQKQKDHGKLIEELQVLSEKKFTHSSLSNDKAINELRSQTRDLYQMLDNQQRTIDLLNGDVQEMKKSAVERTELEYLEIKLESKIKEQPPQ